MPQILTLQPSWESRLFTMNFARDLAAGETVSSVTSVVADPTGLTISEITIDVAGKKIQFRATGTANSYKVTAKVTSSLANKLEGDGILLVKDT